MSTTTTLPAPTVVKLRRASRRDPLAARSLQDPLQRRALSACQGAGGSPARGGALLDPLLARVGLGTVERASPQPSSGAPGVAQLQADMAARGTQKRNLKKVRNALQAALPNRPATVQEIAMHDRAQNAGQHHANRNVSLNQLIGDINNTLANLTALNLTDSDALGVERRAGRGGGALAIQLSRQAIASPVVQRASKVINQGQKYTYDNGNATVDVGAVMTAYLDFKSLPQGQSAVINTDQDDLMDDIRSTYGLVGNEVVKGHLLNDNLGGTALNNNLYPITGEANKAHLHNVESTAKAYAERDNGGMYYKVRVDGTPNVTSPNSTLKIELAAWDPVKDVVSTVHTNDLEVKSKLAAVKRKRARVRGTLLNTKSPLRVNLKKRKKYRSLRPPKKTVGSLSAIERALRKKQPLNLTY